MARDEKARETGREASLLNRRKYLKLASAAVVAGTASSTSATAATSDYETITVAAGETFTKELTDGETWENKLIDITNDGAGMEVFAYADNWTIRNIGVKGENHASPINSGGTNTFWVRTNSSSATATMENIYLGDGDGGGDSTDTREIGGIIVHPDHAGELTIDHLNVKDWSDNGVYGSSPGNPDAKNHPGAGGAVIIKNSFGARCGSSCFRIGTDSSYCENCVAINGHDRGFWGYYEDTEMINCDAANNRIQWCSGSNSWEKAKNATVTLTDCRDEGTLTGGTCDGTLHGSPASNPRTTPPSGVPTSAEEAASGQSSSDDDSSTTGTVLELVANDDASRVSYEFTVEGSVSKHTVSDTIAAGDNDTVTDNGDGTVTVSGTSGNGYGDAYLVDGTFTSMSLDESQWTIRYDGTEVSVAELTGSILELVANDDASSISYEFTVDGTVQKRTWAGDQAAEDNDTVTDNGDGTVTVSGTSGNGYGDSFLIAGEIISMSLDESLWTIRYDGSEVSVADLTGELSKTIVIDGGIESNKKCNYTFTVSGDVEKNADRGSVQSDDTISGSEVSGQVWNGADAFDFSGEITDLTIDGSATVSVEGVSSAASDDPLSNSIVVDGGHHNHSTDYKITVSGSAEKSSSLGSINPSDTVSGGKISGTVWGGKDGYNFSGEITDITLDGRASLHVEAPQ